MKTVLTLVLISSGVSATPTSSAIAGDVSASVEHFWLDTSGSTQQVKLGTKGQVRLQIRPKKGYKVNDKGPLAVVFVGTPNIIVDRTKMGRADAEGTSDRPVFSSNFLARKTSQDQVRVQATFVLCDTKGTFCELKKESVAIQVAIQP
ncbi:MAG: hypothetical protein KTR25_14505 [Myxococcales bacterium]|nr:hypothetical protein [Myxococcales bacterium]